MNDAIALIQRGELGVLAVRPPLALADVDALLVGTGLRYPTFRMVRDGAECPAESLCLPSTPWGVEEVKGIVRPEAVYAQLQQGWTLVLDQLHRQWDAAAKLNRAFELGLSASSRVDVLVVPDGATPPVHDAHDRVVVVCAGAVAIEVEGAVNQLTAGQALVVPRTRSYVAQSARGLTLIAVVSVSRITWRDVLIEALSMADAPSWHDEARMDVHGPKQLSDSERATWEQVVEELQEELDAEVALERIVARVVGSRMPRLSGQLRLQTAPLSPDTHLRRRPDLVYRILERDGKTALVFHSARLSFGPGARRVLEFMAEALTFRPRDLDGVPAEQQVGLCQGLVRAGFLIHATD